uniref:Uncharacterized protein n=1 Tax=viral metagenome TaxID=1070528 RepID=A0A2V0R9X5_9ZZZZ
MTPAEEQESSLGYNSLLKYVPDMIWNNRMLPLLAYNNKLVRLRYSDGNAVALTFGDYEYPVQKPTYASEWIQGGMTIENATVAVSASRWVPRVSFGFRRCWPVWGVNARELNRVMLGVIPGYIESWQFGDVVVPPTILTNDHMMNGLSDMFPGAVGGDAENSNASTTNGSVAEGTKVDAGVTMLMNSAVGNHDMQLVNE